MSARFRGGRRVHTPPPPPSVPAPELHRALRRGDARAAKYEAPYRAAVEEVFNAEAKRVARRFSKMATGHAMTAAAETTASAMVAVYPTLEQADALAQPNGEPAAILHCTLAFLGEIAVDQAEAVVAVLAKLAPSLEPLEGTVGGVASFDAAPPEEDEEPLYPSICLPDVPGLAELRHAVCEALDEAGIEYSRIHGWTPHLTLDYVAGGPTPPPADVLGLPLSFDRVYMTRGDIPRGIPLGEQALAAAGEPPPWSPPHPDEIFDPRKFMDGLRTKTDPVRLAAIEAAVKDGLDLAGLSFDVANPLIGQALAKVGANVTYIADTTRVNVMRTIGTAYDEGLSIPDTAKLLSEGMQAAGPARAELIARTEMAGLVNGGQVAATQIVQEVTGQQYFKRWLTADGAKDPRHELVEDLDGQTVALDEAFDVDGEELQFPGDPEGSPENTCNCRCSLAMVDSLDAEVDGGGDTGDGAPVVDTGDGTGDAAPVEGDAPAADDGAGLADVLTSLNPTGGIFTEYGPKARAEAPLGGTLTTLDKTMGVEPNKTVTVYRGALLEQREIVPGDFVTTNPQLAKDYAGTGHVLEKEVPAAHILDDAAEPLGEEYIYRPPPGPSASLAPALEKPPLPAVEHLSAGRLATASTDDLWKALADNGKIDNLARADVSTVESDRIAAELWKRADDDLPAGTVRYSDLLGEAHLHTVASDGHNTVEQMAREAMSRGQTQMVVSDHWHLLTPDELVAQHTEIDRLNKEFSGHFRILKGIEANILKDGTLDVPTDVLKTFDRVTAGLHVSPSVNPTGRFLKAMENPYVTSLAHPHSIPNVAYGKVAQAAAERNVALEINGRDMLRNGTRADAERMIRAAKKYGAPLSIGADAHRAGNLVDSLYAVRVAAQNGVTRDNLAIFQVRPKLGLDVPAGETSAADLERFVTADPSLSLPTHASVTAADLLDSESLNAVFRVELDGKPYIVKPEPPLRDDFGDEVGRVRENITPGHDLERERAAYVMSRYFESIDPAFAVNTPSFRIAEVDIPSGIERWNSLEDTEEEITPGRSRAGLSAFVSEAEPGAYVSSSADAIAGPEAVRNAGLFDAIIGNTDRHGGNFLLDGKMATGTGSDEGRLWLIDHGLAFPENNVSGYYNRLLMARSQELYGESIDQEEYAFLEALRARWPQIEKDLSALLDADSLAAMQERLDYMIENETRLPPGWSKEVDYNASVAYPWDNPQA
jgi:histidinol phosphatase-like PHP family hydrolase/2'-5' RNA ligase